MATSAFKSTTKRTSIGGGGADESSSSGASASSSSTNRAPRRSRSLSRFSLRLPEPEPAEYNKDVPRGNFVSTVRGSEVPEISLDDLALEFFSSPEVNGVEKEKESVHQREGRLARRSSEIGRWASDTASSRRRGRSVSRQRGAAGGANGAGGSNENSVIRNNSIGKMVNSDANSRRRRSLSVARYQISDSESDVDHSRSFSKHGNIKHYNAGNGQLFSLLNAAAPGGRRLGRSLSQKDLSLLHDGYSSHSSVLTDDEIKDACISKKGIEKTIRAVYAQKKAEHPAEDGSNGIYEVMRKELRHAVEEIRTELEQATGRKKTTLLGGDCLQEDRADVHHALSAITQNYATKLEQSERRKQDLLAEIVLEEQRGRELSKIVRDMVSNSKSSTVAQKPLRMRKRSNDRNRMSKQLVEEAEKYFEDFISNVEDTDISSFDGERSDASSTLGGTVKAKDGTTCVEPESYQSPAGSNLQPVEGDGIILPWLQWETSNDASISGKCQMQTPVTPKALEWDTEQETTLKQDPSSHSISSHGSWSPGIFTVHPRNTKEGSGSELREFEGCKRSQFDMDEYLKLQRKEELLYERYTERQRIDSGGLLLCAHVL